MDILTAIKTRRSVRSYTEEPVSQDNLLVLLKAAMAGPTAHNAQEWRFIVVDDRELLKEVPHINPYARMARRAPVGILVCADLTAEKTKGFWVQDCSAAMENILLAAVGLGLGAVWTGILPEDSERVKAFQKLFQLPEHIMPLGFAVIGHPKKESEHVDRFDPEKIHYNIWGNSFSD